MNLLSLCSKGGRISWRRLAVAAVLHQGWAAPIWRSDGQSESRVALSLRENDSDWQILSRGQVVGDSGLTWCVVVRSIEIVVASSPTRVGIRSEPETHCIIDAGGGEGVGACYLCNEVAAVIDDEVFGLKLYRRVVDGDDGATIGDIQTNSVCGRSVDGSLGFVCLFVR